MGGEVWSFLRLRLRSTRFLMGAAVTVSASLRGIGTSKPAVTRNDIFPIKVYKMSCMGTAPAPAPPNPKVLVLLGRARDRPEARRSPGRVRAGQDRHVPGRAQGNTRHVTRVYLTRDGSRARARRCRARIMRYIDAILSRARTARSGRSARRSPRGRSPRTRRR